MCHLVTPHTNLGKPPRASDGTYTFFFFKGTQTNQSLGMAWLLIPRTIPKSALRGGESGNGIGEGDPPPPVALQDRYDHAGRTLSILLLPEPRLPQQSIPSPASTFPRRLPRNHGTRTPGSAEGGSFPTLAELLFINNRTTGAQRARPAAGEGVTPGPPGHPSPPPPGQDGRREGRRAGPRGAVSRHPPPPPQLPDAAS